MTGHAAVDYIHGIGREIFTELKKLVKTKAIGTSIVPQVPTTGTIFRGSQCRFKVPGIFQTHAFHNTATGKAKKCGMQIRKHLEKLGIEDTPVSIFGQKRDIIEVDFTIFRSSKTQDASGDTFVDGKRNTEFAPVGADAGTGRRGDDGS